MWRQRSGPDFGDAHRGEEGERRPDAAVVGRQVQGWPPLPCSPHRALGWARLPASESTAGGQKLDVDAAVRAVMSRDLHALRTAAARAGATELDVLATLVRSCIVAPDNKQLAVCDYAQIEARVLLWVAGDKQNLAKFGPGKDPYKEEAAALYGIPYDEVDAQEHRPLGKVTTLGCGYQMGPDRLPRSCRALWHRLERGSFLADRGGRQMARRPPQAGWCPVR